MRYIFCFCYELIDWFFEGSLGERLSGKGWMWADWRAEIYRVAVNR